MSAASLSDQAVAGAYYDEGPASLLATATDIAAAPDYALSRHFAADAAAQLHLKADAALSLWRRHAHSTSPPMP